MSYDQAYCQMLLSTKTSSLTGLLSKAKPGQISSIKTIPNAVWKGNELDMQNMISIGGNIQLKSPFPPKFLCGEIAISWPACTLNF